MKGFFINLVGALVGTILGIEIYTVAYDYFKKGGFKKTKIKEETCANNKKVPMGFHAA